MKEVWFVRYWRIVVGMLMIMTATEIIGGWPLVLLVLGVVFLVTGFMI